jgi:hypothetical protein
LFLVVLLFAWGLWFLLKTWKPCKNNGKNLVSLGDA